MPYPAPWLDREAYPFAPHFVDTSAGRVHYVDEGRGPTMLLVHGTPTWSFEFRHLIKAFSPHFRCVAPDHLGFGLSDRPRTFSYAPEAHATVLREVVDHLDLRDFTLVAHDYGGPIGLPLAVEPSSRVARAVLLNTWMWPFDDDADMQRKGNIAGGTFGRLLYRYANFSLRVMMPSAYGDRRRLTPAIHRQYLHVFPDADSRGRVLHALARALNGSRDYYANLYARAGSLGVLPVLIVWGMKDSAFLPVQLERWRRLLPAARIVEIADAGHWPHEERPDLVIGAVREFLGVGL
jgi:haloalkane dehalogenase